MCTIQTPSKAFWNGEIGDGSHLLAVDNQIAHPLQQIDSAVAIENAENNLFVNCRS
jgi:hypothetical protein